MSDLNPYLVAVTLLLVTVLSILIVYFTAKRILKRPNQNIKPLIPGAEKSLKKLKLFLLEREWGGCHGDVRRFIIAAEDKKSARRIAEKEGADCQCPDLWLKQASCEEIGAAAPHIQAGVVLRDVLEL